MAGARCISKDNIYVKGIRNIRGTLQVLETIYYLSRTDTRDSLQGARERRGHATTNADVRVI